MAVFFVVVVVFLSSNVQRFGPLLVYIIQPSFLPLTITIYNFKGPVSYAFISRKLGAFDNVHFVVHVQVI